MKVAGLRSIFIAFVFSLVSLGFFACGGGGSAGGGSGNVTASSGDVAILLTDGPADEFDEINITVVKAELLGGSGRVTIFDGERTFNLLDLKDARVFAIRRHVPVGSYNKIRLSLTRMELVKKDDFGNVIESFEPRLPGNGKLDLVPRGDFVVSPARTLVVQIDMDAHKSIHIVGTGSDKYQVRPVVFVDVISGAFLGKFIQLHGVIEDIETLEQEFKLCETDIPVRIDDDEEDHSSHGCIEVSVVADTSIFDEDGMPTDFGSLVEGDEATVFGRLRRDDDDDGDDNDDDSDDDDDDDDRLHSRELDDLELTALVIELGIEDTFQALDGVAQNNVDSDDQFRMEIDPNQGFVAGTEIYVQLQDGTKIINLRGDLLSASDIEPGVPLTARGVMDLSTDPDTLKASLLIVDTDAIGLQQLSGTIGDNPDDDCGLALLDAEDPDNADDSPSDRSIRIGTDTKAFLVTSTASDGSSEQIAIADLEEGMTADIYGSETSDGCFDAEVIIAFDLGS